MQTEYAPTTVEQVETRVLDVEDDLAELSWVRRWARSALSDLSEADLTDTIMVLDELVSNALRHGTPPRQVRLLRRAGWLRIEVDDSCRDPACPRPPSETGGRGLALVEQCTIAWGQEQRPTGKTVWAEIVPTVQPSG
ncbi:ATP-binding protein [Amycolatopsis rifamycinica]|uniref:Histidine kinase n=1 Tax=Amycolatopsis rifamycinica TaxID=287986 RepID=A0A066U419_9PSEU|nr:ATP-binding protein [Amycolatopsis rifamycinica]KDN21840.1 histidine kinase [Amycolatopsis rifamycinica]